MRPSFLRTQKLALAHSEGHALFDLTLMRTTAAKTADGYVLNGKKSWCWGQRRLHLLLVVARTSGDAGDKAGLLSLALSLTMLALLRANYPTNGWSARRLNITFSDAEISASVHHWRSRSGICIC
ncbi:MAG: hypothetical protein ACFHHU_18580 [Porticoccaceae bacterium]